VKRVLCFGSLNLDYVYSVEHFAKPGETVSADAFAVFEGGKGLNQAVAAALAGSEVSMAGAVGDDGRRLVDALRALGADTSFVSVKPGRTGHAIIEKEDSGANRIIIYGGANFKIDEDDARKAVGAFSRGDFIMLQNEINLTPFVMTEAKKRGMRVVFNPSPVTRELMSYPLEAVDIFILNEIEISAFSDKTDYRDALDDMCGKFPHAEVVLTVGRDGSYYCGTDCGLCHVAAYDVEAVDTTAAGDTFTGYLVSSLAGGSSMEAAVQRATAAAALAVMKNGAMPSIPCRDSVDKWMKGSRDRV